MAAARSRKRLSIWGALPAYLGGKRRLCPPIFREIDRVIPRSRWSELRFLDGFLGGGSVSLFAKAQGFAVTACDIAERSVVVGRALVENSRAQFSWADVLQIAGHTLSEPGPAQRRYVPSVFTPNIGQWIDQALAVVAKTEDPGKAALIQLLVIKVAMLAHPMSQVRPGTAHRMATGEYEAITESCVRHYVDALTLTMPANVWKVAEAINAGVMGGSGMVLKGDVLEILPDVRADVAYFDPPYPGTTAYEKEYRILDEIFEGRALATSPFSKVGGTALIDQLLDRSRHIPVVVVSCGNAELTLTELEAKMTRLGRHTRAMEIPYAHKASVAREAVRRANRELLVVGVDLASDLVRQGTRTADTASVKEANRCRS